MKSLRSLRQGRGLSQRNLAQLAKVSYKTLQLLEAGETDVRLSTLDQLATALGFVRNSLNRHLENFFLESEDSVRLISKQILENKGQNWQIPFFNFVDAFRIASDGRLLIEEAPVEKLDAKWRALIASTVESLCHEKELLSPSWCEGVPALKYPWFVSGIENLKATALVESPAWFRKRNIFVLENFLERR